MATFSLINLSLQMARPIVKPTIKLKAEVLSKKKKRDRPVKVNDANKRAKKT